MKILKFSLSIVAIILASITIIFSLGSLLCKFTELPQASIIQIFGYLSFYWVLVLAVIVIILILLLGKFRLAISYMTLLIIFTLFLNDFSFNNYKHKIPENSDNYENLSVAAYNVRYYSFGIEKIAKFFKSSNFDVILLSESVLTPEKLDYLKNSLNNYTILSDGGNDLSLLSRYPVVEFKIIELPSFRASLRYNNDIDELIKTGTHRSFIHAIINVNGTLVNVLSLRLIAGRPKDDTIQENLKWGRYLMSSQIEELATFLSYLKTLKGPFIFGGDLNVPPNSGIVHEIRHYSDDAYLEKHIFGSFTFKVWHPVMRLDYIFHSIDVVVKNSEIIRIKLSDHYPIRAEFLIKKDSKH